MFVYRYLFVLFLLFSSALLASAPHQAALLANDAYLPTQAFIQKYKDPSYNLYAKRAGSIRYFVFDQAKQMVVVFEGTQDLLSLHTDLSIDEVDFMQIKGAKVHRGYYGEALDAAHFLKPYLKEEKPVIITGHSLGGAVGHLLAGILFTEGYRVQLYTFGEPPVGNQRFVKAIETLPHERYTHIFDIIPKLKKEYMDKLKEALKYVNQQLPENTTLMALVNAVDALSYDYVHQGNHHYIYNLGTTPPGYDDLAWYEQMVIRVQMYHSSKNYVEGVE